MFLRPRWLYFIFIYFLVWDAQAQNQSKSDWEKSFIQSNKDISEWFDGLTEGIDLFLVGEKITQQKNKSSFRIDNTSTSAEGENFSNTTSLTIKPRLHNLEEYFQLKFTTFDEDDDGRGVEGGYLRKNQRRRNYGASVGFFRKLGQVRTTFQPRIQLEDPLQITHNLAFESVSNWQAFQVNPKLELFASPTKGTGTFQAINIYYVFNPLFNITLINEAEYQQKINTLSTANGFAIGHQYLEKTLFTYSLIFNSTNRESYHLESYSVFVTWNQMIYRNILSTQLTPRLDFEKEKGFKGQAGLVFNISLNF